jgi:hypothetical protein
LLAVDANATRVPSADTAGSTDRPFAGAPSAPVTRLTSVPARVARSYSHTVALPAAALPLAAVGRAAHATKRPSAEIDGSNANPRPPLTCSIVPACRSRTQIRERRPCAPRFPAALVNATKRPSAEIDGS